MTAPSTSSKSRRVRVTRNQGFSTVPAVPNRPRFQNVRGLPFTRGGADAGCVDYPG